MARTQTWEVSDQFWALVEPLIPQSPRIEGKTYARKEGGGEKGNIPTACISLPLCMSFVQVSYGTLCRVRNLPDLVRPQCIVNSNNGQSPVYSTPSGAKVLLNMTSWRVLRGFGRLLTGQTLKHRLPKSRLERIQPIGEKNGSKRNILVDEHGVPLSFVVCGANRHDSVSLDPLLKARAAIPQQEIQFKNLCLDAGYVGKEDIALANGYIPHIRPRGEEKKLIERNPSFTARRWVVELAHSWFNRFRKLVPRYEKTDLSYNALTALAAGMIVLNKIMIIYR